MPVVWKLNPSDKAMLQKHNLSIPANVHAVEYTPQNDLLGHPALRAFVTQGGSNSALEVRHSPDLGCMLIDAAGLQLQQELFRAP